jgi:hypothetical protein
MIHKIYHILCVILRFMCRGIYVDYQECMKKLLSGLLALFLVACASAPSWQGMSEREISQWKAIGFDSTQAQNWRVRGFGPTESDGWIKANFNLDTATIWAKESFNVEEAQVWSEAGFEIEEAVTNRSKGLTPVRAN